MTPTLKISQLTKRFGDVEALKAVSLSLEAGKRTALLGHNGAGKSTLMKIVLGLIPFDGGEIEVCGLPPGSPAAREQVAYLPENAAFHPALTGEEQLAHYLALRGESPKQAVALLARVGLEKAAKRRIGTYSKGMRQRVGLAQTLIGNPRLLVLDEPTSGLDPVSRRDFYDLLDGLSAQGTAILLSSHVLTEVEARTDSILILSGGQLVAEGTLAELRARAALPVGMVVRPASGSAEALAAALSGSTIGDDGFLHLSCRQEEKLPLLTRIVALGGSVADLDVTPPSLEDVYSHFSRRDGQ
jgi:Cu-processing system ATP-binding protein